MGVNITHLNGILLPDGSAVPINKSYKAGMGTLNAKATFLTYIANTFGDVIDPTALGSGKEITLTGTIKNALAYRTDNNDGSGDTAVFTNAADIDKVYNIGSVKPVMATRIVKLPTADYSKIGYKTIAATKTKDFLTQRLILARKTLLEKMITAASGYKFYKAGGVEGTTNIAASTGTTIAALSTELEGGKLVVGTQLDESKLYEKEALLELFKSVADKYSKLGITIDEFHPTITDGIGTDELIAITTTKVANNIAKSDYITQLIDLPSGISTQVKKVAGIQIVEDTLVAKQLSGKARVVIIPKFAYGYIKDTIAGQTFLGHITTGQTGALLVNTGSGTATQNILPNDSVLTFNTTAYAPELLKGLATIIRVK